MTRPVLLFAATPPDGHSLLAGPGTHAGIQLARWMEFAGRTHTRSDEIHQLFEVIGLGGPDIIDRFRRPRIRPARAAVLALADRLEGRVVVGVGHAMRHVLVGQGVSWPYGAVRTVNLRSRAMHGVQDRHAWVMPEPALATVTLVPYPAVCNYRRRRSWYDGGVAGTILLEAMRLADGAYR